MEGYLLDTNIFSWLADAGDDRHNAVNEAYLSLQGNVPVFVSAITHGEVEYGIQAAPGMSSLKRDALYTVLSRFPVLEVSAGTRQAYGRIRKGLFEHYVRKGRKQKRPEQLIDPVTSERLQVQENDIWITALALEYNLTLVTHDTKMKPLWDAAGADLHIADWADSTS